MHTLFLLVLILKLSRISDAAWCVCRTDVGDAALQKTLDYACGAGADCTAIQASGACFMPNTVRSHCSYAVNSYFQRKGQVPGSCDFAATATATLADPSYSPCSYPSLASSPELPGTTIPPPPAAQLPTNPVISFIPPPSFLPPPPPSLQGQGTILPSPFTPTTTTPFTPTTTIPNTLTSPMNGGGVIGLGPPAGFGTPPDGTAATSSSSAASHPRIPPLFHSTAILTVTGLVILALLAF